MPDARAARDLQIVDPVLTNIARAYRPGGFIFDQVMPRITVEKDSGLYPIFTKESFFGDDSDAGNVTKVSDRARTPEISIEWSTDTYLCEDYRLMFSLTAKERKQAHEALRLEQSKLQALQTRMAIRREVRAAAALSDSGTANGQLTGGTSAPSNNWNVEAATIEEDIKAGALAVRGKIGHLTNAIAADVEVWYAVALQQDIRDIVKYTVPGDRILAGGRAILPPVIHGHKIIVAEAMRNTARKGGTTTLSKIWGDDARLLYLPDSPGWGEPSVAYSFECFGEQVDRWKENDPPVEFVRAWEDVDEKVTAPEGGYTLTALLT